ncbi:MAG: DUF2065 domain-containing protein [Magnetococcales bacterium]|nr:DUF2065 domain-containing protein [Magnetococcales bacterium]
MNDFITALGLLLVLEGVPYFLSPSKMRIWVIQVAKLPDDTLRKTGLVMMMLGLFVIYLVRT